MVFCIGAIGCNDGNAGTTDVLPTATEDAMLDYDNGAPSLPPPPPPLGDDDEDLDEEVLNTYHVGNVNSNNGRLRKKKLSIAAI